MQAEKAVLTNVMQVFTPAAARNGNGGYFVRICQFSREAEDFIWQFHETARTRGVIIEDGLPNPDPTQIQCCRETIGTTFRLELSAITEAVRKWLPKCSPDQIQRLSTAIVDVLNGLKQKGKSDSILSNCYIKYMCWIRFKFERTIALIGGKDLPKVLYAGKIGQHELHILSVLRNVGCDVLLLQTNGDQDYLKLDAVSEISVLYTFSGSTPFPAGFSLKELQKARECAEIARHNPSRQTEAPGDQFNKPSFSRTTQLTEYSRPVSPSQSGGAVVAGGQTLHVRLKGRETPAEGQNMRQLSGGVAGQTSSPNRYPISVQQGDIAETNSWMPVASLQSILVPPASREGGGRSFCNCFIRQEGAPDRLTFQSDLQKLYQQIKNSGRKFLLIENEIPKVLPEEIAGIKRINYRTVEDAVFDLSRNLTYGYAVDLQPILVKSFIDLMITYARQEQLNVNKATTVAVYMLCWLKRYQRDLFAGWKKGDLACFILFGACKTNHEALFLRFLACLPTDVMIIVPKLEDQCVLNDDRLLVVRGSESVPLSRFPHDSEQISMATSAFMAERDLDQLMYADTGIFREHQFSRTNTVTLQTSIDEVSILWDKDLKYRPSFSTNGDVVSIPVIFAKINGVHRKKLDAYWSSIKAMLTENTILIPGLPQQILYAPNSGLRGNVTQYLHNGILQRSAIKNANGYPLALLRNEMQEYVFDKIQIMLDHRMIVGTFENGTEYAIISTVLSIGKQLIRLIQKFDFTKQNPKVVVVHTGESQATKADAILFAFLNLIGFDVVFFVPTGYQCIEQWYTQPRLVQHQAGDYMYDLTVPDFNTIVANRRILRTLFNRR